MKCLTGWGHMVDVLAHPAARPPLLLRKRFRRKRRAIEKERTKINRKEKKNIEKQFASGRAD